MKITIQSSSIVRPIESTPNEILPLSDSDQLMGWTHSPTIYVYKAKTHDLSFKTSKAIDSLKNSLTQILVPYYPFAGRLRRIAGSRFEIDCCAAGVEFIQAYSDAKLDDYGDFIPSNPVRELSPKVDYSRPIEELPVVLVQLTKFSCGGITIGMAISHILADGNAAITFVNSLASIARGEKTRHTILQPYHDRKALIPRKPLTMPRFEHVEYHNPPLLIGRSNVFEERDRETEVAVLKVSKEEIERLKKRANEVDHDGLPPPSRPYSRYESVAGHIWVSMTKARTFSTCTNSSQLSRARISVDVRKRLQPPLPDGFSGNATLIAATRTCEFGELLTKPLGFVARKIRDGTSDIDDEYAKSALDFLASQEDIGWIRTSFHTLGCTAEHIPFWGNPNLGLGSWISLPMYDADFGWGKPDHVGPTVLNNDGKSIMFPGSADDGSFKIAIRLQTRHMGDFKKIFYQDL